MYKAKFSQLFRQFALLILIVIITKSACIAQGWEWARTASLTHAKPNQANATATDKHGNVIIAGWFNGAAINFGSYHLINSGTTSLFLTKYDAQGNVLWANTALSLGISYANSVAVDSSGNIYMCGFFWGQTVAFGNDTLTNNGVTGSDIFVAKYDSAGNIIWAKNAGGTDNDFAQAITIDSRQNVCVAGYFNSASINFGTTTLINDSATQNDIFVAKLTNAGNWLWAKQAVGKRNDVANAIIADTSGFTYLTGSYASSTIQFDTFTLTNANSTNTDLFLTKYDSSGNVVWAKSAGGSKDDAGTAVKTDNQGHVYLTGYFFSPTLNIGSTNLTNAGTNSSDLFLAKYNTDGTLSWATSIGGAYDEAANSLACDDTGNVYVAGYYSSPSLNVGSETLFNAGDDDILIAKFNTEGNAVYAASAGGSLSDVANSIAIDSRNNFYIAGYFGSTHINFGFVPLNNDTTVGITQTFLSKFNDSTLHVGSLNTNPVNILVYPNPTTDYLNINFESNKSAGIKVYDCLGNCVNYYQLTGNEQKYIIDMRHLKNAVYHLLFIMQNGSQVELPFVLER